MIELEGLWIGPKGNIYKIPEGTTHGQWMEQKFSHLRDPWKRALSRGWVAARHVKVEDKDTLIIYAESYNSIERNIQDIIYNFNLPLNTEVAINIMPKDIWRDTKEYRTTASRIFESGLASAMRTAKLEGDIGVWRRPIVVKPYGRRKK